MSFINSKSEKLSEKNYQKVLGNYLLGINLK